MNQQALRWVWAVGLMAALLLALSPARADDNLPDSPEILWDTWGVPHIFAPDDEGLFYAFGWAQAHNHADLILRMYAQARGRAAEYGGADFVESDKLVRTLNIPQQARDGLNALDFEFQDLLRAFAAGFNDYAAANPDAIDPTWAAALPVQPEDVVGHGIRVLRYSFVARTGLQSIDQWQSGRLDPNTSPLVPPSAGGSNAWAVAPSRSASGSAMLVSNPHQPWSDLGLWMEAHLVSPSVNAYGAALVGNPVLGIAFNDHLGWTHTVNTHDGWDLYEVTPSEWGYALDYKVGSFETREETIQVRQADGSLKAETFTALETVFGPVIAVRGDGQMLSLRVVGEHSFEAAQQWWEMAQATNLSEFEDALRPLRIPMFTIMYADRDGNILHVFNEQVPVRDHGDWAYWNNTTPIDSSRPALLQGDSTTGDFWLRSYLPYEDLPRVLNPDSGWLQNANEPPWTTTLPLAIDPSDYPPYISPPPFLWPRPQTSMRLMAENSSLTFEQLIDLKQSTFVELTRWCLDDLLAAAKTSDSDIVQKAAEVLAAWDRHADADSRGAVLFAAWAAAYIRPLGFAAFSIPFDINDPLNTPRGLADPAAALAALETTARQLEALRLLGGGMDVAYGDIFRIRYAGQDLPASGGDDLLGTFRTLTFEQDTDLRFRPVAGESYIAVIEFGQTARARVLLAYGNATQPDSPHFGDQIPLFAAKQLRDAWRTPADILAHLEKREVFPR